MNTISWGYSFPRQPKSQRPGSRNFEDFVSALLQIALIVAILL